METGSLFSEISYALPLLVPPHLESDSGYCSTFVTTTCIVGSFTYKRFFDCKLGKGYQQNQFSENRNPVSSQVLLKMSNRQNIEGDAKCVAYRRIIASIKNIFKVSPDHFMKKNLYKQGQVSVLFLFLPQ